MQMENNGEWKSKMLMFQISASTCLGIWLYTGRTLPTEAFYRESDCLNAQFITCFCCLKTAPYKSMCTIVIGGGTKYECWNPKWISMSFQYIRVGKTEFLNLVTIFTLHIDHQDFQNHYVRVKNQSCRRPMVWPIQTWARRALGHW